MIRHNERGRLVRRGLNIVLVGWQYRRDGNKGDGGIIVSGFPGQLLIISLIVGVLFPLITPSPPPPPFCLVVMSGDVVPLILLN